MPGPTSPPPSATDLADRNDEGVDLLDRAQADGDPELLQQAIAVFREVLARTPEDDPHLANRLGNLSAALATRQEFFGAPADLDDAVALARRAVRCADDADPELPRLLSNLASTLATRCELGGSTAELDEAVTSARRAVATMSPDDDRRAGYQSNLSAVLELAHSRTGRFEDLDAAVAAARAAVTEADPAQRTDLARYLVNLSNALYARYRHTNSGVDLDDAVHAAARASTLVVPGHVDWPGVQAALGAVHMARFAAGGDVADVTAAVDAYKQAAAGTPVDHPHRSQYLANMSNALRDRFEAMNDESDLNRAVSAAQDAVDHPNALGNALLARYEITGRLDDLDEACTAYRSAVARAGHASRPSDLANLSSAVHQRFVAGGDLDDMRFAIKCAREAVAAFPPAHRDRSVAMVNLVKLLYARFSLLGQSADLDEAIDACRVDPDMRRPDHLTQLSNLAALLRVRHTLRSEPADLAESVATSRAVTDAVRDDHPLRAAILTTHGNILVTAASAEDTAMIDEAITAYREAVTATPPDHVARPGRLASVSAGWAARFARTRDAQDLDQAITAARDAAAGNATDDPDHARRLSNLGLLLTNRYALTEHAGDLDAAAEAWDRAMTSTTASPQVRVAAAHRLAGLAQAANDDETALHAYTTAVELMPRLGWRGVDRATRREQLELWSEIATEAAACALDNGLPEHAVELLENGRAVIWAQLLQTRSDLTELRTVDSEAAEQLLRIRTAIDGVETELALSTESAARDERVRLAHEWDVLVETVRGYDGFANFLKPQPFAELRAGADGGPVVIVNMSRRRCDAIVVTTENVSVVELRAVTADRVSSMADEHLRVVTAMRSYRELTAAQRSRLSGRLREILAWLWDDVAEPVLDALDLRPRERDWPRLWWCPTGLLGLLPLHAAQRYDSALRADVGVLDRVVSSYTPGLAMLCTARATRARPGRALVVGLTKTRGLPDLPQAYAEATAVARVAGKRGTVLVDATATVAAVRAALPSCTWLHFAGHSGQDLDLSGEAALHLYDGKLTAADIAHLELARPAFAFLSSCESGLTAPRLPDEALQLAAALQVAGYQQVVATLWSIGDQSVPDMVERFYALGAERGAEALHVLLRDVRRHRQPSVWAGYFHCGA